MPRSHLRRRAAVFCNLLHFSKPELQPISYRKRPKLTHDKFHNAFVGFAERAASDFDTAVGRYVIMPDHLHFFVAGPNEFNLGNWVGILKRTLSKALDTPDSEDPVWQRGFFAITCCGVTKATCRNGNTCGRTRSARGL